MSHPVPGHAYDEEGNDIDPTFSDTMGVEDDPYQDNVVAPEQERQDQINDEVYQANTD